MADVHDSATRSYNMSMIRGKNTKPEIVVRKFLFSKGYRYKIHVNKLPGKPDIVLSKFKVVIFIHGCFWHKHDGCKYSAIPKTRTDWWMNKLNATVTRDHINQQKLSESGWNVITIWECELKPSILSTTLDQLLTALPR